jgi:hypothetical protein
MNPLLELDEERRKLLEDSGVAPELVAPQLLPGTEAPAPAAPPAPAPASPQPPTAAPLPPDVDDAALVRAYLAKKDAASMGQVMNAAALMNRGFGGSAPLNAGDAFIRGADADVEQLTARRALADADLKRKDEQFKREQIRIAGDMGTDTNQLRMALIAKHFPEAAGKQLNPEQMPALQQLMSDDVALRKANKTNAQGGPALSPDAARLQAKFMQKARNWDDDTTELYYQTLVATEDGKNLRNFQNNAMSSERIDAAKETAEAGRKDAMTRHGENLVDRQSARADEQVDKFGKELGDGVAFLKTGLGRANEILAAAKTKYGGVIPGANLVSEFIGKNRLTNAYLNSTEERNIRELVNALNIEARTKITGAAFGEKEANDLKQAYADLSSSENLEQSLERLRMKVNAAVKLAYKTKGPAAQAIIRERFPELVQGIDAAPSAPGSGAPALPTSGAVAEPEVKVIGGKRYVKIGNDWHEEG